MANPNISYRQPQNFYRQPQLEEDEEEPKKKGFRIKLFNPLKPIFFLLSIPGKIQRVINTGCGIIFLIILAIVLTIWFKPPFVWNPVKDFLNNGIDSPKPAISVDSVYSKINSQVKTTGSVSLTEEEVSVLFREVLTKDKDLRVALSENKIQLLINIDSDDKPLWLVTDIDVDSKSNVQISRIGFGRIAFPQFLNSVVNDSIFGVISLTRGQIDGKTLNTLINSVVDKSKVSGAIISVVVHKKELILQLKPTLSF